jgi:hypothetical protein
MRPLITSVRWRRFGVHDVVRIWNRGGYAGELTVDEGDGALIADVLLGQHPADRLLRTTDDGWNVIDLLDKPALSTPVPDPVPDFISDLPAALHLDYADLADTDTGEHEVAP